MVTQKTLHCPETTGMSIYQVIISRLDGTRICDPGYRKTQLELVDKGIGGFILFGGARERVKAFVAEIQSRSRIPLFIASDIERGVGQQVQGMTSFPSQMAIAAAVNSVNEEDISLLVESVRAVAAEAKDTGINMPLIPVLDVNRNPDNPIICTRAFSDDPELAAWFGSMYIRTLEGEGLISCAKHFPGHGDTSTDSHIALPVIRKDMNDLIDVDIMPFREAFKAGASSVMIGHLSVPAFDPKPASLSRRIMTDLLRRKLGFKGLVLTDALNMHALREFGDAGLECLKAGADILLHPEDPDATASALLSALEEERLDPGIVDAAVRRIIGVKAKLRDGVPVEIDFKRHSSLSRTISQQAITLVKNCPGLLPVSNAGKVRLFLSGENKYFEGSPLRAAFVNCSDAGDAFMSNNDVVLVALFTSVAAWRGTSGIGDEERQRISGILRKAKRSIVVSFGSPYVLRYFKDADVLIAAYDSNVQAQEAVLDCLRGVRPFEGRLPVRIPGMDQ